MTLTNSNQLRRRPSFRGLRSRPGFSVLEMLVVVVLVGIVMSVAGVRVSTMMTQQRVIRAAGTVQTDMELAFALASRNRTPTKIVFTTTGGALLLTVTDRTNTTSFRQTDLRQMGLVTGNVTASSAEVTVFPNGFASDTLSITVTQTRNGETHTRRVRMSRAGMVKVI